MGRNELASAILDYSHTMTSKAVTVVGGVSAVSHTPAGSWIADAIAWFHAWPWMTTLSYVAIILLVIERSFIVAARISEYRRTRAEKKRQRGTV